MSTAIRSKEDIEFHRLGYGYNSVPAVNVKVHFWLEDAYKLFRKYEPDANPHFTVEWIEQHTPDDDTDYWMHLFSFACESGWEQIQGYAEEIWGKGVKVYSEGRSGGWAYVDGIDTDVDSWDAIDLARWRRFAKFARAEADDVPYQMVSSIYINEFDAWVRA